jgi:hypothetical protein
MFRVVWDKQEIKKGICSNEGEHFFLDFNVPVQIYIDDVDITNHKELSWDTTNFWGLFLNLLYVFQSIDPEKLSGKQFCFRSNIKNKVFGGRFEFYVDLDRTTDALTVRYSNQLIEEFCSLQLSLRDFSEGIISSESDILDFITMVAPEQTNDDSYLCLRNSLAIVQEWYRERYGDR